MITRDEVVRYERDGFLVVPGFLSHTEVDALLSHYMSVHSEGGHGWTEGSIDPESSDPLKRYPRLLQMHRFDMTSLRFMLDPRIREVLEALLGSTPYAVQTMMYYKPAGARGQALHQDQRYLNVRPGTCMAAWLALDDCDEENGCLQVVPGSHRLEVICPVKADSSVSFTTETVPVPEGMEVVELPMKAGDMLFFNGQLIHGSRPNRTADRFRRIVVGHYIVGEAQAVASFYHPVLTMDGREVKLEVSPYGGPCGAYVGGEFRPMSTIEAALAAH
jgi:hypothetical protein